MPGANKVTSDIAAPTKEAIFAMNNARLRQNVEASMHCRPAVNLQVGIDYVLVTSKCYQRENNWSQKLLPRWIGPFKVIDANVDLVNYCVHWPQKQNPWVHLSALKKWIPNDDQKFPSRQADHTDPVTIDDELEWEVEEIVDDKLVCNKQKYLVKWKG